MAYWLGTLGQKGHLDWPIAVSQLTDEKLRVHAYLNSLVAGSPRRACLSDEVIQWSARIAVRESDFGPLAHALQKIDIEDRYACRALCLVAEQLAPSGWRPLVSEAILEGDLSTLLPLATIAQLIRECGGYASAPSRPTSTTTPPWSTRYPSRLHPALAVLAASAQCSTNSGQLVEQFFPCGGEGARRDTCGPVALGGGSV